MRGMERDQALLWVHCVLVVSVRSLTNCWSRNGYGKFIFVLVGQLLAESFRKTVCVGVFAEDSVWKIENMQAHARILHKSFALAKRDRMHRRHGEYWMRAKWIIEFITWVRGRPIDRDQFYR